VKKHNKPGVDNWVVVEDKVLDVTHFKHRGGQKAIDLAAGKGKLGILNF
jgi:cytochrome b involved in lipid metabolism